MLWALADPARAQEIIDDASHITATRARHCIDALRTVYWFAMDQPDAATEASTNLALDELPAIVGTETAWALAAIAADAGRTAETVTIADAGYASRRAVSTLRTCDSTSLMHISAPCCCLGASAMRWRWPSACAGRQPTSQGQLNHSVLPLRVGPHSGPAASIPPVRCWNTPQQHCPPWVMPSAGDTATTSRTRPRWPCAAARTRPPPPLPRSTSNASFSVAGL
jgi:hypothetical protein